MTVRVARIVGFPTSSTAALAAARRGLSFIRKCRSMFSATMIESSITIPVTKIRAKSVTRFRVYPKIWYTNSVSAKVIGTASITTTALRQPMNTATTIPTAITARPRCSLRVATFSLAVSP